MLEEFKADLTGEIRYHARVVLRYIWVPNRSENIDPASFASVHPGELLRDMFNGSRAEIRDHMPDLDASKFPVQWQVDSPTKFFLDGFIRSASPSVVFETGVADGVSTRVILEALDENGHGLLDSVDISEDAGELAKKSRAAGRWRLRVLARGHRAGEFKAFLRDANPLDVFLHDSDHRYYWQLFEYREAWKVLRPGGWLLSDDIDASYAFIDFCRSIGIQPRVLVNPRKLFGILQKPGG